MVLGIEIEVFWLLTPRRPQLKSWCLLQRFTRW